MTTAAHDLALDRITDWADAVDIPASPQDQRPLAASTPLLTFHLPGQHDQHSHGHGAAQIEDLPRMKGKPTVASAAQGTNPHYGSTTENPIYYREAKAGHNWTPDMGAPPRDAYEENCTNTVMAFEMRMRGYDVHAGPLHILDRGGYAGGRTTREFDDQLKSSWTLPGGRPHWRSLAGQEWRSHKDIDKEVRSWPEGGRGVVWSGKHVYSVVKVGGKTQYVESQFDASPSRVVTGEYRRKYAKGKLIRLDYLEPAGGVLDAVVPA